MSHVSVLALEMVLESFHEHRTRYRASLVIFTHLRIFPPHLQPTHFPINTFSFVVQSTAFCTIVTSLNCLVTDKVSHNSKCSTCSTPQYKNLQKNSKFQKISKKKYSKILQKNHQPGFQPDLWHYYFNLFKFISRRPCNSKGYLISCDLT
jgi:hypothetical protein